jgi:N-acetylmuramoyl-L-alanine amidase
MTLPFDTPLARRFVASPNHGERLGALRPDMLVLHYTGMPDARAALARLADEQAQVSCHYFVFEDGEIVQMVPEQRRAWHAGQSTWEGHEDINSRSIGIEIANPGHEWGYVDFPRAQLAAVTALCCDIVRRHRLQPQHVLGHSDIAPMRKEDPGEKFDWRHLALAGAGLWAEPAPIRGGRFFAAGDAGEPVAALQAMFALYGYGIEVHGRFDALTEAVTRAFQRHFRPERVDGVADRSTIETLHSLLALKAP